MFLTGTMCCIVVSKTFDPKTQLNLNFLLVLVLTAQSCLTLGSSVHGDSPSKNTGAGCHFLLQGIFGTQGSNPCLLCGLHWQVVSLPLAPLWGFYTKSASQLRICFHPHPHPHPWSHPQSPEIPQNCPASCLHAAQPHQSTAHTSQNHLYQAQM